MVKNKLKSKLFSIVIVAIMILGIGQSAVFATSGSLTANLSYFRYIKNSETGEFETKGGYALNTGSGHPVFQIYSTDESNTKKATNFYCLNATVGTSWINGTIGTPAEYTDYYNMATENGKSEIEKLGETTYSSTVTGDYYNSIMWILDNMYTGEEGTITIDELLAKAGIIYGNTGVTIAGETIYAYYYDETINPESVFSQEDSDLLKYLYGNTYGKGGYWYYDESTEEKVINQVVLTPELVEVVQQAAIWYFTNGENAEYDCYTLKDAVSAKVWLKYTEDTTNTNTLNWPNLTEKTTTVIQKDSSNNDISVTVETGKMLQEQASILYNYLVDSALAVKDTYTSTSAGTIDIAYTGSTTIVEDGDNYKIGPMAVTTTGSAELTGIQVITGTDTDITSNATITNASGTTIENVKVGEDFYVIVPKANVTNKSVKITANGKYTATIKNLWISNNSTEQPIVEVSKTTENIVDSLDATKEKQFDLALRKSIVKINGVTTGILNENGLDATRKITVNSGTIPDTAIYTHRKDPVVVTTGSIVTYRINIYNEGEIAGYASKIVDQLPTGLKSKLETGATVTSNKGNVYNVTYDKTNNTVTFTLASENPKSLSVFDGTTVDTDYIELDCEVSQEVAIDGTTKHYLTNIAYIAEEYDVDGNKVEADRSGNESKPGTTSETSPIYTANNLNNTTPNVYKGNNSNQSIYNDTNNDYFYKGQEDDDDFETVVILPKEFDLKLMKYISAINGEKTSRTITIDTSKLNTTVNGNKTTTADYDVSKVPLAVATGDYVTYTLRIYNEGEVDGYAKEITEDIPDGLKYVWDENITVNADGTLNFDNVKEEYTDSDKAAMEYNANMLWGYDAKDLDENGNIKTISTNYLSKSVSEKNLIKAFDSENDNGKGSGLSYKDVSVMLKVVTSDTKIVIRNEAEISEDEDENGNSVIDRDSDPEEWEKKDINDNYEDDPNYPKYEEDDEDYDNIKLAEFDLALRKFISKVSPNGNFGDTSTVEYNRVPNVDTTALKAGTATTATYNHSKEPVGVEVGDYILYTIRVYNEGDLAGYASKITDYLPEYLTFIEDSTDSYISGINSNWEYDNTTRKVTTTQLKDELLDAFDKVNDNNNGSGLDYADVQIICRVNNNATIQNKITNIAEISEYQDKNKNVKETDRDSEADSLTDDNTEKDYLPEEKDRPTYKDDEIDKTYVPGQEDDDDFEKLVIKNFDLALRKFITEVQGEEVTTRIPEVTYENGKITYTHPKDVVKLHVDDTVIYTIRIFNEGGIAGFAEEITDDLPEYLEYLPENEINKQYRWIMYDEEGNETEDVSKAVKIVTDYTSYNYGKTLMEADEELTENPNLLNAFDSSKEISDNNPDYVDVKVAFKVLDPNSNTYVITNKAQISEDADENGNPIKDIDSIPDEWNDGEDDQDYENVGVEYFDLALLKYVSDVIVTEGGKTTTTKTGNTGSDKDIIPKVEIYRKSIDSTVVKFKYTIKITNEGDIAGYAKEITDYVPTGLKFYAEDNTGWKDEGNNVISTKLLENKLLQPGESATVTVVLRWVNGEKNLDLKTNIAEISEDYNDKGVPDKDSTPDNKKEGEDDIDDASVLLTISTGILENTMMYIGGALIILVILAGGVIAIKKYVL